ncbi:hypothetical protein H7F51_11290 [Novosphingobium flavum]|uniref:Enterochelin esterase n=1 Tax=Novosphingobium flavum TaxID=1778672 RepID=A0A7X1KLZ5_9SPHN|nr:alpha/beta hydrolase-fold protein [Novosphingobium flavum]MBC2666101.1 hypothetical protein [Novosphingobium flavum]
MNFRLAVSLAALAACAGPDLALGQAAAPSPLPVAGAGRQTFKTTEVLPDRSVVFKIAAPEAPSASVIVEGEEFAMTKDAAGVWSVTTHPMVPQLYAYLFKVAGGRVNPGDVTVPGTPPGLHEPQNVPHGTLTIVSYYSRIQNRARKMRVYLPPEYYSQPKRRFPVLYLVNPQDETEWTEIGRANVVLDNLIATKKAVPMIVVMPNNTIRDGLASSAETVAVLEREIPQEIMPWIEGNYRTLGDRANRAIAGLSFGGGTAFGVGMRNLPLFDYVGEFGTGTFGGLANPSGYTSYLVPYDPEKIAPGIYKNLVDPKTKPKLFYMSCGQDDPRLPFQKQALADFRAHGVQPVWADYPGGHDYRFFRAGLADFASRLFRP